MVVEADESDGSFLRLGGTFGIVTNIDPEHLDHWGDFEKVRAAFAQFIHQIPFYGAGILCIDHPEVQALIPRVGDRRIVTYGFAAAADVRGENVTPVPGGNRFSVIVRTRDGERIIADLMLPMPGRHNVQNALSAVAVALELGLSDEAIRTGFARFGGVKRRFTKVGETAGMTIIDDYGHHPVEIRAVLAAAREGANGRVLAVVQPHRFTRLRDLMADFQAAFNDADAVYVAPVYTAGEAPIAGVDADALATGLLAAGHRSATTVAGADDLAARLAFDAKPGDMVVCLGAGDITKWAAGLAAAIEKVRAE
jgi:UDP-N-acetylmuramate--alanine ligase